MNEKNIIEQKDHIILPKATLMRFIDDRTQRIYYLDLNDLDNISVKKVFPKSYHSSPNYYNPEYDNEVKKYETSMGELYKEISSAIEQSADICVDGGTLKRQIIDFITIEYHRSVIADDRMLEKYKKQQQEKNDKVDSLMFQTGMMTSERIEYSINYREKARSNETFRTYAQNILGTVNSAIEKTYYSFSPKILYIPENCNYDFLLPQLHFIGNEQFACFILSPRIALALYPVSGDNSLLLKADKERVEIINLRILESVSVFYSNYREIVGKKEHLEMLKSRIEEIKTISRVSEREIVIKDGESIYIHNMNEVLEFVIILHLLMKTYNKAVEIRMTEKIFDKELYDKSKNEIEKIFEKYYFNLEWY